MNRTPAALGYGPIGLPSTRLWPIVGQRAPLAHQVKKQKIRKLRRHLRYTECPSSMEETHAERLVEAVTGHWALVVPGSRYVPDADPHPATLAIRLDYLGLGIAGSDLFVHLRQRLHGRLWGGLAASIDVD